MRDFNEFYPILQFINKINQAATPMQQMNIR